jgi:hypothetical protein
MPAIGMGVLWAGYAVGLYGYCLIKGYDVTFGQLIDPRSSVSWPPGPIPDGQVLPGKAQARAGGTGKTPGKKGFQIVPGVK